MALLYPFPPSYSTSFTISMCFVVLFSFSRTTLQFLPRSFPMASSIFQNINVADFYVFVILFIHFNLLFLCFSQFNLRFFIILWKNDVNLFILRHSAFVFTCVRIVYMRFDVFFLRFVFFLVHCSIPECQTQSAKTKHSPKNN